jgi:glucose/arabinose dehydrogenase
VHDKLIRRVAWAAAAISLGFLTSCGGGGSGGGDAPVPTITSPAEGATFRAGDTLNFAGSATDPQDGSLAASNLTWWVEFHHGNHTHPGVPQTSGASGALTVPLRFETAPDVWYRFHLRATDSSGRQTEVTRDVMPQRAQVTLASMPPGLQLTLGGTPVVAPHTFTGVVGLLRDIGAATTISNGRLYTFTGWSHGGAGAQTIATPAVNTTYTANFVDSGPAPPLNVMLSAPANASVGSAVTLTASVTGSAARVEFFDGVTPIGTDTTAPYGVSWTPATGGDHSLTARAVDAVGAGVTSAAVNVAVSGAGLPTATLSAPQNLASGLTGTLTLRAEASDDGGVAAVEFQIDGTAIGEDLSAPYEATLNTAAYTTGQHIVRARARDGAGNHSPWASATVAFGGSVDVPAGFTKTDTWIVGLSEATAFAQAPDGRIFVVQQDGTVRVVRNGALLPAPFHQFSVNNDNERGLLGVALHPNFASNGWIYVHYTRADQVNNRISRVVANGDVSTGAETVIRELSPLTNPFGHMGGAIHFGPDGKLYVAVGDHSDQVRAPVISDPVGKMLRFNEDGSIPNDNPFCTTSELHCAVWAYGLRNPFTFAIDPASGRMHINDVGAGDWEEIDLGARGADYGWPASEGPTGLTAGMTGPIFAYRHPPGVPAEAGFITGQAIAGGAFYPANGAFPAGYRGSYFFGDYSTWHVDRLDMANGNAAYAFVRTVDYPVDLLVGQDGALYVLLRSGITRITSP